MNYLVSKRIPNAEAFLEHCERLSMKSRAVVFRQGEPSEDLYLILDGLVSVIVDDIEDPEQEKPLSVFESPLKVLPAKSTSSVTHHGG